MWTLFPQSVGLWGYVGNRGKSRYFWMGKCPLNHAQLIEEYHCRLTPRRVSFPAKLRKQLDRGTRSGGQPRHLRGVLVIYPKPEWDKVNAEMSRLSSMIAIPALQRKFAKGHPRGVTARPCSCRPRCSATPASKGKAGDCVVTGLGEKVRCGPRPASSSRCSAARTISTSAPSPRKCAGHRSGAEPTTPPATDVHDLDVLFDASLDGLALQPGGTYVDCLRRWRTQPRHPRTPRAGGTPVRIRLRSRRGGQRARRPAVPPHYRTSGSPQLLRLQGVQRRRHPRRPGRRRAVRRRGPRLQRRAASHLDVRMDPRLAEGADSPAPHGSRRATRLFRQFGGPPATRRPEPPQGPRGRDG